MVSVLSSDDLYQFTGGSAPSLAQLSDRYRDQVEGSGDPGAVWLNWIVRIQPDGQATGFVQATVTGALADLAWVIGIEWQGQGHATEAATAMRTWLADQGVTRFTAHIHPAHRASEGVASAVGLVATGTFDEDGEQVWVSRPASPVNRQRSNSGS